MSSVMKRLVIPVLVLLSVSCESVRTVYDANGNVVDEDAPGGEKDLMSHFEKQFSDSFSEQKGEDGVPVAKSKRVSRFQADIDGARREDKTFSTKSFLGKEGSDLRSVNYTGTKSYDGVKRQEKDSRTAYSTDLRPDFMNETHGISSSQRYRHSADDRSEFEGASPLTEREHSYLTGRSHYDGSGQNGYIETRRDKTPPPDITNFRDYYRKTIKETRNMMGRE